MASVAHLARRFLSSVRPGGPPPGEVRWVERVLSPREMELWRSMSGPDQRHSAMVARRVERSLGHEATPAVLAAALLHDVGKTISGLRTYGRVIATVSAGLVGHDMAPHWAERRGFIRKVGLYLQHDQLGADLLAISGSDPLTVAWAREHHWPESMWSLPLHIAQALRAADDD